jgi:Rod binding domain-containing protein
MTSLTTLPNHATNLAAGVTPPAREKLVPQSREKIDKAAQDFTAVALGEMLSPLFETLPQDGGSFGGGQGEAAWRPMLVQEIAKSMALNGGLGITTLVTQAMLRLQENRS